MKPKERMSIPRQIPKELDSAERIKNFKEVTSGYDEETAIREANRCLQCKKPTCIDGCPINNDIPAFIKLLREKKFEEGYWKIRETSTMPAVCSRVCPHEFQCEGSCVRASPHTVTRGLIMQKACRNPYKYEATTVCKRTVSGTISLP